MARIVPVPTFRNYSVFELLRGVRAFLNLDAGITRGTPPDPLRLEAKLRDRDRELREARQRLQEQEREIQQHRRRISDGEQRGGEPEGSKSPVASGIHPENIIWALGSPRTGSTWLGRMASELEGHSTWNEPFLGAVFGVRETLANQGYTQSKNFVLGEPHRGVWISAMRRMFMEVCASRFPGLRREDHLLVKEPNGSVSAPLIMEAFPESRMVFLIRDPRDVVASLLDAAKDDSWYRYDRYEASLAEATARNGRLALPNPETEDQAVEQLARNYVAGISATRQAYEAHGGPKALVKYEELCADAQGAVKRMYSELGISVDEEELRKAVEKHAWENLPESDKGSGRFHRKGTPGGWKDDLTPEQVAIVERVAAPILEEFYHW